MSRARHMKKKAAGGRTDVYEGGESNVVKEADEKKHGGRVKEMGKAEGHKPKHRADKRARGGKWVPTNPRWRRKVLGVLSAQPQRRRRVQTRRPADVPGARETADQDLRGSG